MSDGWEGKDLKTALLWDAYGALLTETQRGITDLYFNYDLSLAEIAEQKGVSRQSVSDCLGKSRKLLEEYERKLGFASLLERERLFSEALEKLCRSRPELKTELDGLKRILDEEEA